MHVRASSIALFAMPALLFGTAGLWALSAGLNLLSGAGGELLGEYLEVPPLLVSLGYAGAGVALLGFTAFLAYQLFSRPTLKSLASAGVSLAVATSGSVMAMRIAWLENTQGEIHGHGYIEWEFWSVLGLSACLPFYLLSFVISSTIAALTSRLARARGHAA